MNPLTPKESAGIYGSMVVALAILAGFVWYYGAKLIDLAWRLGR